MAEASGNVSLADLPPTSAQRRIALVVLVLQAVACAVVAPFPAHLPRIDGFVPVILTTVFVADLFTAVLLFGQCTVVASRAVLILANGYLFSALIVIPHALTFPGSFAPKGLLGAGVQSSGWLNVFWHLGFLAAVAGYATLKGRKERSDAASTPARAAFFRSLAIQISVVCALTWGVTAGERFLPRLFLDDLTNAPGVHYAAGMLVLISVLVLLLTWARRSSVLDLWVMVTICMTISEMALVASGLTARFYLGWYVSRALAVAVSTVVLIALLSESMRVQAALARAYVMLERERKKKLISLTQLDLAGKIARIGSFVYDDNTKKLQLSPGCAAIYGLPEGTFEISRADWRARVHPGDLVHLDAIARRAFTNGEKEFVLEFRIFRDGQVRWIESRVLISYNEAGKPVRRIGAEIDVTERKQSEQALAERNAQFALASRAARVGRYAYDGDSDRMQVSEGYAAIHGLPEGTKETTRRLWRTRAHPEDAEHVEARRRQAIRDRQTEYTVVYRIILPDRGVRWVESRSFITYDRNWHPKRVVGVNIDVTERRRTEQALIDRNNQIALSGKTALVGSFAIEIDPAREHVAQKMRVSPGFAAILGLAAETEEISVGNWRSRVYPADLPEVLTRRHQALAERRSEHQLEYRIVRACGTLRWIESRTSIEYDEAGQPSRLVGVNIDITERKKLEEQRNALIGELDHRVKNALSTVSAVISRTTEGSRSLADFVAALEGRIRSMAKTQELLSVHRWQGISLRQLIQNELAPFATGSNTELEGPEVILTPEAGQATAMVFHELVTNAAKYGALSTQSGRVVIRWDRRLNGHPRSHLVLEWQETGGPPVIASARPSYGMSTIRDLLPYEFGAAVDLALSPEGVRCRVELPADWLSNDLQPISETTAHALQRTEPA